MNLMTATIAGALWASALNATPFDGGTRFLIALAAVVATIATGVLTVLQP